MNTLTHYLFFLDSQKNTVRIKPRRGICVEQNWGEELKTAVSHMISSNAVVSNAIATSFAEKKNQVVSIKVGAHWIRTQLIFLEKEGSQPDELLLAFNEIDGEIPMSAQQLESDKCREDFFVEMTHEIRSALNIILGNSRLIKSSTDADQTQLIENTIFGSEQLLRLANDYLDRIKTKQINGIKGVETKNLMSYLHSMSLPFKPLAKAKKLVFECKIDPNLDESVEFPSVSIGQVINNLLNNAINHTDKGTVVIQAALLEKTARELKIVIKVQDTGAGISKTDQESIFSRFVQLRPDIKEGTGLGLSITKKIMEDLGGKISVTSTPGQGSEFKFQFTAKRVLESERKLSHSSKFAKKVDLSGIGKILVIDDNPINLMVVKRQLAHLGVQADLVESGEEAIKALASSTYSLALVDMSMPHIDGLLLSTHIRQFYPNVKIAIFTAGNIDNRLRQIYSLNITSILTKPYSIDELRHLLFRELTDFKYDICMPSHFSKSSKKLN